jgi:membrane fusion protein, adhesin transport system
LTGLEMRFLQNLNKLDLLFWGVFALFSALVVWSILFKMETSINVDGQITPLGKPIKLQNRFEGKVLDVLIKEGEEVSIGEKLILFETEIDLSELNTINAEIANLIVRVDRLNHQLKRHSTFEQRAEYDPIIYAEQQALLKNEINDLNSRLLTLDAERDLKNSNLISFENDISVLEKGVSIAESQLRLTENLFSKGFEGKITLMEKESELLKALSALAENNSKIEITKKEIALVYTKIEATLNEFTKTTSNLLVESNEELRSLNVQKDSATARIKEFYIESSHHGVVSKLAVGGPGEVLDPGAVVMEIIPSNKPLVFYAKLPVQYAEDVSVGQKSLITPSTTTARNQKPIPGVIETIAPDSQSEDGDMPYYEVMIKFDENEIGSNILNLKSGITGTCSIITGKRSVLNYFLDPILISLRGAMSEG